MSDYKQLAKELARELASLGFTVHRYDARSTESVYLKLDYGACGGIRISGHRGLDSRYHRYNIGPWVKQRHTEERDGQASGRYYPEGDVRQLVQDVLTDRDARLDLFGRAGYAKHMEQLRKRAKKQQKSGRGFWRHARKIRKARKPE